MRECIKWIYTFTHLNEFSTPSVFSRPFILSRQGALTPGKIKLFRIQHFVWRRCFCTSNLKHLRVYMELHKYIGKQGKLKFTVHRSRWTESEEKQLSQIPINFVDILWSETETKWISQRWSYYSPVILVKSLENKSWDAGLKATL